MDNLTPEQIKQMIIMLQSMLPSEVESTSEPYSNENIKTKSLQVKKQRANKFDEMAEKTMHKSDSEIDKKLAVREPVPRTRNFVPVKARCRVCGKEESVNPALIYDGVERYKCNKCAAMAG